MARLRINMPDTIAFTTKLRVRIADINRGNHLGNHMLISYINDAWFLFVKSNGFDTGNIEGLSFINTDLEVIYKAESSFADVLKIDLAVGELLNYGVDLYFKVTNESTGKETAMARMRMLFFDYTKKKVAKMPPSFRAIFEKYDVRGGLLPLKKT